MSATLNPRRYAIIALAVITALIHLGLGISNFGDALSYIFILNGIGYIALVVGLYFIPQLAGQRALIRWALLGFTAVTFILYFVFNFSSLTPFGLFDKAVELVLIILLWLDKDS